jgi:hypothetical protein
VRPPVHGDSSGVRGARAPVVPGRGSLAFSHLA